MGSSGGDRKKVGVGEGKRGLSVEKNGVLFKSDGESLIRSDKDFYGDSDVYDGEWVRDDRKSYILRVLSLLLIEILIVTLIRGQMMSISSGDGSHMHMTYRGHDSGRNEHWDYVRMIYPLLILFFSLELLHNLVVDCHFLLYFFKF